MKRQIPTDVRTNVLERDAHKCVECGSKKGLNLHHLLPEKFGGFETPDNLITLCAVHHKAKHVEFHMYYGDSRSIVAQMRSFTDRVSTLTNNFFGLMGKQRLKPVLFLLTRQRSFRPKQERVIRDVLAGKDVLFVTPTGSGKSLCFQLPGLLLPGPTLVISPLKSLMKDQVEGLLKRKIPATYINSDLSDKEKATRTRLALEGLFRFLYVTPERFFKPRFNPSNRLIRPYEILAIDEAHCIDLWGRNFRPSYAKLGQLRNTLHNQPTLALTATASKRVQDEIVRSLGIPNAKRYVTGFYRREIELYSLLLPVKADYDDQGKLQRDEKAVDAAKADFIRRILTAPKYYRPNPTRRLRLIREDVYPRKLRLLQESLSEYFGMRRGFYSELFKTYQSALRKRPLRIWSGFREARSHAYAIPNDDKLADAWPKNLVVTTLPIRQKPITYCHALIGKSLMASHGVRLTSTDRSYGYWPRVRELASSARRPKELSRDGAAKRSWH